jgi:hypothetical protein
VKRLAIIALVVALAACGSDNSNTGPTDKFTGHWTGPVTNGVQSDTTRFDFQATQSGSSLTGTVLCSTTHGGPFPCTFSGTSTPPTITLSINIPDDAIYSYNGVYVSSDSISGTTTRNDSPTVFTLDLKKQ